MVSVSATKWKFKCKSGVKPLKWEIPILRAGGNAHGQTVFTLSLDNMTLDDRFLLGRPGASLRYPLQYLLIRICEKQCGVWWNV